MVSTGHSMKRVFAVVVTNIVVTVITAALVGPAASKLHDLFGLVAWAGRLPFYLLPLFIGPLVLWTRVTIGKAGVVGFFLSLPLVLWSVATQCPPAVWIAYAASGTFQGSLLSWLALRMEEFTEA